MKQKARIKIYTNVRHCLEQAKRIYENHLAIGESSPLSIIDGFSWEATGPKISFCLEKHKQAISLSKTAEEMYRQRDAVLAEITDIMQASKSILKNTYTMNPEQLHDWGLIKFDNVDSEESHPP